MSDDYSYCKEGRIRISSACFARIGIYSVNCLLCSFDSCCLGSSGQVYIRAVLTSQELCRGGVTRGARFMLQGLKHLWGGVQ